MNPTPDQLDNPLGNLNINDNHYLSDTHPNALSDRDVSSDMMDFVDDDSANGKQVIVGICAMEKKAQSKPMKEILKRLEDYFEFIKTQIFEESVILNKPIEEWPHCDCLISFHSKGFPLSKAIEYARLRKPFLINDLDIQYDIQDRRKVYKILEEADIELPRYAVLDRDSSNPEERELIEGDDHIEVAKVVFNKPFVEKPISAEDHNICIYYPAHAGGGSQRLFRKIGCRSSVYSNESHVRKTGSYIYEEFMPTDGTDVKVYTAGPDYAHAEARKSPALDGKVERDSDGKEIRYPVILTNKEKLIARKVCLAFKQTVCGFDLLRANGRSYVCDVNGFSFVKSSMKYYEDCSKIIGNLVLRALAPQLHIPWSIPFQLDDPPIVPTTFGRMMELRCVIAVIRHGDRTPKQKMKLEVKHPKFFELYQKYGNPKNGQAKLKKPQQLQEVLDIARYLLGELADKPTSEEVVEPRVKLRQLKSVLEMYGHFSGINRKVQLKYQPHGRPRRSSSEDDVAREPSLVLILKWGGELTPAGRVQAEDLGRCFRRLYPASGDYSGPQGLGLLRLHSTFRHDLKIYASDEGRVQMTAAAFAKGFLALEGELTPILFQMVKSANTNGLLDNDCESSKCQKIVKERLHNIMQKNCDLSAEDMEILNPTDSPSIGAACKFIGNPYQACDKVHKLIKELNSLIRTKRQDNCYTQEYHLYHGETWDLLQRRWAKLEKDFKFPRTRRFDISKIPDIYDCIKYDLQHNQHTLQFQHAHEMHTYAKALADIVIPQEYGMTAQEKVMIGLGTCSPLLRKIQADLLRNADSSNEDETESVNRLDPKYSHGVSSPDRHVRTRLYFTSESHIHSLVTALQYGGLLDVRRDEQWRRSMEFLSAISELNYLSQIVIMLYEDPTKEPTSDDRFHVEIHFSSGVINRISNHSGHPSIPSEPQGPGFRPHLHNKSISNASTTSSVQQCGGTSPEIITDDQQQTRRSFRPRVSSAGEGNNRVIKEESFDCGGLTATPAMTSSNSGQSSQPATPKKQLSISSAPSDSVQGEKIGNTTITEAGGPLDDAPSSLRNLFTRNENDGPRLAMSSSSGSNNDRHQSDFNQKIQMVRDNLAKNLGSASSCQSRHHSNISRSASDSIPTRIDGADEKKRAQSYGEDEDDGRQGPSGCNSPGGGRQDQVIAFKNNWKAYEQYLASEWTNSPQMQRFAARRRFLQNHPQSSIDLPQHQRHNLPQSYQTVHHVSFSPSGLDSLREVVNVQPPDEPNSGDNKCVTPDSSPSVRSLSQASHSEFAAAETNPQSASSTTVVKTTNSSTPTNASGPANLHQRYMAFKQSGGGSLGPRYATISASMPIHYKSGVNPRARSVADVSQYCVGPSSLISTAVISGSSPELIAVCPYSPIIRPLETLHNELSLKQFIDFIVRLTNNHRSSSILGPTNSGTSAGAQSGASLSPVTEQNKTSPPAGHQLQPSHISTFDSPPILASSSKTIPGLTTATSTNV